MDKIDRIPCMNKSKGVRESNFELLRLVAMFLVMVVHADFWSLGFPTAVYLFHGNPLLADQCYRQVILHLFESLNTFSFLLSATGFILVLFFSAILVDQPRKWIWRQIEMKMSKINHQ